MTLRAVLDWQNQDSTEDLNSRFTALFTKGVITGGTVVPVVGDLQVSLQPFTALSNDGMLVTNDTSTVFDIPLDQTNVIALHAKHVVGDAAVLELVAVEISIFNGLVNKADYVVFGTVLTVSPAAEVVESDISYALREMQDKRARDKVRGQVEIITDLPSDPNFNVYGDIYVVYMGVGSAPNLYAWDGIQWVNITGANAVAVALDKHRNNLDTTEMYTGEPEDEIGRLHLSNYKFIAAMGSYGTPGYEPLSLTYPFNRYVTELDPRIPTQDQSDALIGSDGSPSATNKYVTQEYFVATPTLHSFTSSILALTPDIGIYGPFYVGTGVVDSANAYFSLLDYTENKGYLNSSGFPCKINAVYKSVTPTFVKLDPSTDPLVDAYGFYNGTSLWLGVDITVDTSSRLVYGKKAYLKTLNHGFPILPTPNYEIINGTLLYTIANIKGRSFDEVVPDNEQNINLRSDLDNLSAYIGSVLETNVVAANEDFIRLAPVFPDTFQKNIGVDYTFSFENTILSNFEYNSTTGIIHYFSAVNLSLVVVGDIFIDAEGNHFKVTAVDDVLKDVTLSEMDSISYPAIVRGAYPEYVVTSVDGSIIQSVIFTFINPSLSLVSFTYTASTGIVQYGSAVNLSSVTVGNLFRDGGGTKYLITSVDDPNNRLVIVNTQTGVYPTSINNSVGSYLDGSCWINNNPRDLLLSEMKFNFGAEFVPINKLVRKTDEYSLAGTELTPGQIAFGIVRPDNRFDPRIVFYGSWENYKNSSGETYTRNTDGVGKFVVTGYFTDVFLVMRRRQYTSSIAVYINSTSPTTVDPSIGGIVSSNLESLAGPKHNLVKLNSTSLSSTMPTTITGKLPGTATVDSFDVYGFVFVRANTSALFESGKAFESAKVVRRDMPNVITVDTMPYDYRGGRLVYAVDNNTYLRTITNLTDMDSNGSPSGTWASYTVTITTGSSKLASYSVNDIVILYASTASKTICRVTGVNTTLGTLTVDQTGSGTVSVIHVCSTNSVVPLPTQEAQIARYILPDDFINHTPSDLEYIHQSDRFVVGKDGLTVISGQSVLVTDVSIIGSKKAIQIQDGSAGKLRFNVLATRMDVLCVNAAAATIYVSIDGSPEYAYTISAGAQRKNIFSNARYQTHEVSIRVITGNFSIGELLLFGPQRAYLTDRFPNEVADISQIAAYRAFDPTAVANTLPSFMPPIGSVFREASVNMTYVNVTGGVGTAWAVTTDYSKTLFGNYIYTDLENSYAEFYFLGSCCEIQHVIGPDHGISSVYVDGIPTTTLDAYSAAYGRKNCVLTGLSYGVHRMLIQAPVHINGVGKNASSSGYKLALTGFYECNDNTVGLLSYSISKYGVYSSLADIRVFNPLDMTPLDPSTQITDALSRSAKVSLTVGTKQVIVTLAQPYVDSDYIVIPSMINTVDSLLQFQPPIVTAQSASSFTLTWNVPLPTSNYVLQYYTKTLDVG